MRQILKFEVYVYGPHEQGGDICFELYTKTGTAVKDRVLHFGIAQPVDTDDIDFVSSRLEEVIRGTMVRVLGVHQKLDF